jgi:integrase
MLANEGTDTLLIQAHLGHRDIRNTTRYTSLYETVGGSAGEVINPYRLLGDAS